MFKDKKEELSRLEAELLLEAEAEAARLEEELEEAQALLDDENDYGSETEETYFNYSNRYGKIQAYNNDTTDDDLDAYSDEVYQANRKNGVGCLTLLTVALLVAVVFVLGWYVLRFKGII